MHIIEKVLVGSREDESMVSKKTVAVIFGGQSSEHEVSRTSAVMMLQALYTMRMHLREIWMSQGNMLNRRFRL